MVFGQSLSLDSVKKAIHEGVRTVLLNSACFHDLGEIPQDTDHLCALISAGTFVICGQLSRVAPQAWVELAEATIVHSLETGDSWSTMHHASIGVGHVGDLLHVVLLASVALPDWFWHWCESVSVTPSVPQAQASATSNHELVHARKGVSRAETHRSEEPCRLALGGEMLRKDWHYLLHEPTLLFRRAGGHSRHKLCHLLQLWVDLDPCHRDELGLNIRQQL
mmetsp:Transcript_53337/g.155419  ORF Transcript_53337/g.155419 Transcript_53337/m.155419 type:complete len:222 (-) Transcript_53337:694-1359(-)